MDPADKQTLRDAAKVLSRMADKVQDKISAAIAEGHLNTVEEHDKLRHLVVLKLSPMNVADSDD